MPNRDLLLYLVHGAFWTSFGVAGLLLKDAPAADAPVPQPVRQGTAPYSRAVLAIHFIAFGVLYFGLGNSILPGRVVEWIPGQRLLGTLIIMVGAALMSWARVWFHSWRFRARVEAGHQLATGGPFRYLRHPIYMGLNLLALGSAVWDPTPFTWAAVALMVIGSDLRGRAEERLLSDSFGAAYTEYMRHTSRFLPKLY